MERTLQVERLYFLGDFRNIKFSNTLTGIPEEIARNERAVELLFMQQYLSCEIAYRRYHSLIKSIAEASIEEALEKLEKERTNTMQELYEEIRATVQPALVAEADVHETTETQEKETE